MSQSWKRLARFWTSPEFELPKARMPVAEDRLKLDFCPVRQVVCATWHSVRSADWKREWCFEILRPYLA